MMLNLTWAVAVVLIVLMTASVGQSHQMSVSIDHVVKRSPCPFPDCFPIYYRVCIDFLTDRSYCSRTSHPCNDQLHCASMKMHNETFSRLRLPHQAVTNETFIKVYIAESLSAGIPCRMASAYDCRYLNTSYQFSNENFSFHVTLTDVPTTSNSSSTPIHSVFG
ncbi:uncharacterized protein LOC110466090 [Mizuhopecten yessoensis]|uniref:uncharacterized protein LOC110466090 n=1 Tax=Mizuhopecten yessoensis TaxID=6573 RepID=UPI000B45C005|nr:uncharacterized protein LOC110466090 [Mizuhopecten yessoensis]